jgi:hypothetical protein
MPYRIKDLRFDAPLGLPAGAPRDSCAVFPPTICENCGRVTDLALIVWVDSTYTRAAAYCFKRGECVDAARNKAMEVIFDG